MYKIILLLLCMLSVYGLPLDSSQMDAPWHVHLNISNLRCGGSLYKGKYIITAAHCFDAFPDGHFDGPRANYSQIHIYIGEWKLGQDPDCNDDDSNEICDNVIKKSPASIKIHEKYDKNNRDTKHNHDIAIITIKSPPRESDIVGNVLLSDDECDDDFKEQDLKISGFGETSPSVQAVIRKRMDIKVFEHKKCLKDFQNKVYNPAHHICGAGKNGLSTCKGDSGGGAVSQITDDNDEVKTYLQGIVVFGSDVCGDGKPTGLLKVSCFTDWINGVIDPKSVKQKSKVIETTTLITSTSTQFEEDDEDVEDF
ncbi:chymotrypsin-1-like [Chironomus tepperi]|uniref:chymotrypsin-1-like n=1 Tax=Chironomus tepperi TaxID=113505 RepID=UPI00391F26D6